jgi:hypothetical protein
MVGSITDWVNIIGKTIEGAVGIVNLSRNQVARKLTAIRENLEQFKEAAANDDASKMRQLLESCKVQSEELEKRVFKGLDDKANKAVRTAIKKARISKSGIVRRSETPSRKRVAASKKVLRVAAQAKSAGLASALDGDDKASRKKLMKDIDTAIGKLQGICISLETSKW